MRRSRKGRRSDGQIPPPTGPRINLDPYRTVPPRPCSDQGLKVQIDDRQWPLFKKLVEVTVCVRTRNGNRGAGVVISPDGLILTAWHTLERAGRPRIHRCRLNRKSRQIVINRTRHTVDIVFCDERADIAVLKMRRPPKTLKSATLGDSSKIDVGTAVYRVGLDDVSPLTSGYLLQWSQHLRLDEMKIGMPGAPGSSGGGAFNIDGELVGIVLRAIFDSIKPSCCFAIPIDLIRQRIFRRRAVKKHLPSSPDGEF